MATSNEELLDAYVRHQTYMLRYAGSLRNQGSSVISKTDEDVYNILLRYGAKLEGKSLINERGKKLLAQMEQEVLAVRLGAWQEVLDTYTEQLKSYAANEATLAAATIDGAVPVVMGLAVPPVSQLNAIVNSQPFEGATLKQWMERTAAADVDAILRRAKTAIVQGITPTQMAAEIAGEQGIITGRAVSAKAKRDIESVLLTVTNGIQQEVKQALYEENSDIIKEEIFLATLDGHTTLECATNDHKRLKRGEGPMPPLHFRCRSLRVPYLDPDLLGKRPFKAYQEKLAVQEFAKQNGLKGVTKRSQLPRGLKGKFDKFAETKKAELIGQVAGATTFSEFFARQSAEFQRDYLGPARYELYKKGEVPLSGFVAPDGREFTLDEITKRTLQ